MAAHTPPHGQPGQPNQPTQPNRNHRNPGGVTPIQGVTHKVTSSGALASIPKRLHMMLTCEREMARGRALHGPFHSYHEAYAVALEEMDELWEEIKRKENVRDVGRLREEAIQVAAVLIRMCEELT